MTDNRNPDDEKPEAEHAPTVSPSPELEEALREAVDSVERAEVGHLDTGGDVDPDDELDALRAELLETQDKQLRLQADFENFRRRAMKEREELVHYGYENLVKDLLSTVDNLDRAIDHARQSDGGDLESLLQGVELVQRELQGILLKHSVSLIEAEGAAFDPAVHEAMAQAESDAVPPNTVLEVLQKGYQLRDRLLRPSRVVVSKASEGKGNAGD